MAWFAGGRMVGRQVFELLTSSDFLTV